ncbi:MAG: hypothetical protein H0V47_14065 [Chloroflexia bacterium]|nr:hypothetical protein [Chloroflexia bacterium]
MQSVSSRRINPTPHVAAIAGVVGLAILGGIITLEMTDTLPGRAGSTTSEVNAPAAVISQNAGEGLVSPRHLEAILGSGATLAPVNPVITYDPADGQGEGLVGAGGTSSLAAVGGSSFDRADTLAGKGGALAPALTAKQMHFLEINGVNLSEAAPAATSIDQYIAGPFNEGYIGETTADPAEYVADPYQGGPTER